MTTALVIASCLLMTAVGHTESGPRASTSTQAVNASVPLRMNERFLLRVLEQAVFRESAGTATVWDDGSGCNYLTLSKPSIEFVDGAVRLLAPGNGRIGKSVSARSCLNALDWSGYFESWQELYLKPDGRSIGVRVIESRLLDSDKELRLRPSIVWHWAQRYAHPRIEKVSLGLTRVIENTRQLMEDFVTDADKRTIDSLIDSLRLEHLRYDRNSIVVDLGFTLEADTAVALDPEPDTALRSDTLTDVDVNRLGQALDGFITHTVRHAARSTQALGQRQRLLDVMLNTRHRLDTLIRENAQPNNSDFRQLFVSSWNALTPILAEISDDLPNSSALNYLNFIAAGDILSAIDAQGSRLGIELSVRGLRRLAASMPGSRDDIDPIAWQPGVDRELRHLFGFGLPLPLPNSEGAHDRHPSPSGQLLDWLIAPGYAGDLSPERLLVPRLNRWIVDVRNARRYVPLVDRLLNNTTRRVLEEEFIEKQFRDVYRPLVAATAWQESCFRQFINQDGRRTPLTSSAGAVGLMQIRPVVWRGFYDTGSLKNDIGYNARAGAEILLRGLDNLAAATYAAYNGGPKRSARYRDPEASARARKVDNAFAQKFRTIRDGDRHGPLACFGLK